MRIVSWLCLVLGLMAGIEACSAGTPATSVNPNRGLPAVGIAGSAAVAATPGASGTSAFPTGPFGQTPVTPVVGTGLPPLPPSSGVAGSVSTAPLPMSGTASIVPPPIAGVGAAAGTAAIRPPVAGTASVVPPIMMMPAMPFTGEPMIPAVKGTCPKIASGSVTLMAGGGSLGFSTWVGAGGGPLVIYWHGTGASGSEVLSAFGQANIDKIVAAGGIVAAAELSSGVGSTTTDLVWTTGDGDIADQLVACAVQNNKIDPKRIHTLGYSAGGMQTTYMWYSRAQYLASVCSYSGGPFIINVTPMAVPYLPPAVIAHGAPGADSLVIDFGDVSQQWGKEIASKGGFAIDCNDGGAHIDVFARFSIADNVYQFFKDHPYNVKPEPYTTITGWPSYCKIVTK